MEKIKQLLQKAGVSEELAAKICESLETYKSTLREQFEKEFSGKVEQAKQVCVEETEAHKRELARRLQIFCEAKEQAIEAQLAKQSALSESEAVAKLRSITEMLSGLANGTANGQSTAVVEKAKKQIRMATEEKNRAVETANRQTAIAEKALKENRRLATEMARLQKMMSGQTVTEGRQPKKGKKSRRIDQGRSKRRPTTSRPTILENQDPRPAPGRGNQPMTKTEGGDSNGFTVDGIAKRMSEDLV